VRRRFKLGLTLVEILVVMAILVVLAAIIASATANSRRAGYAATCTSNLRQAAVAMELYLADNGGVFPEHLYSDFTPLLGFIKDPRILACPLDPFPKGANGQASKSTGIRISLFAPLTIYPEFMSELALKDANHGVLCCLIHGVQSPFETIPDPVNGFTGLVLRARKDTSVQRRIINARCFEDKEGRFSQGRMYWDFFTDEPMPDSVKNILADEGAREIPCR